MKTIFATTADGVIKAYVEYNAYWEKYQLYIDGSLYEENKDENVVLKSLQDSFLEESIIKVANTIKYNGNKPLFYQLSKILNKSVVDCHFERLFNDTFELLKHTETGQTFHCIHERVEITLQKYCELYRQNIFANDKVILKEGEYKKGEIFKNRGIVFTTIEIPVLSERLKRNSIFVRSNENRTLYQFGKETLFILPETDTEIPEELTLHREFMQATKSFTLNWREQNPYIPGTQDEYNQRFKNAYTEFVQSSKETYRLTEDDIKFFMDN